MSGRTNRQPAQSSAARQPNYPRQNEYFVPRDGIDREVIQADICRYLGNDALVRPGWHDQIQGYYITAYRNLTTAMIEDLKADSARWETERRRSTQRDYKSSDTYNLRQRMGPSDEVYRDHYDQGPAQQQPYGGGGYGQPAANYPPQYSGGNPQYSGSAYPPTSGGGYPAYSNTYPAAADPRGSYPGYGQGQGGHTGYGAPDSMDVDMTDPSRGAYSAAEQPAYQLVNAYSQPATSNVQRNGPVRGADYADPKGIPRDARDPYARDSRNMRQEEPIARDAYGRPIPTDSMPQASMNQPSYGSAAPAAANYPYGTTNMPPTSGPGNAPATAAADYSKMPSAGGYSDPPSYTSMPHDGLYGRGGAYQKPPTPRSGAEQPKPTVASSAPPNLMPSRDDDYEPNPPRRPTAASPSVGTTANTKREQDYTTQPRPREREAREERHHKSSNHHSRR